MQVRCCARLFELLQLMLLYSASQVDDSPAYEKVDGAAPRQIEAYKPTEPSPSVTGGNYVDSAEYAEILLSTLQGSNHPQKTDDVYAYHDEGDGVQDVDAGAKQTLENVTESNIKIPETRSDSKSSLSQAGAYLSSVRFDDDDEKLAKELEIGPFRLDDYHKESAQGWTERFREASETLRMMSSNVSFSDRIKTTNKLIQLSRYFPFRQHT